MFTVKSRIQGEFDLQVCVSYMIKHFPEDAVEKTYTLPQRHTLFFS